MPVSGYFKGSGQRVLSSMQKRYGDKKGTSVFYATANSRGMASKKDKKSKRTM